MIEVKLERGISTKSARVGDEVTALVTTPLKGDKDIVVPGGSRLQGRVDFVQRKTTTGDGWLRLVFTRIQLPDGRGTNALASATFEKPKPRGSRDRLIAVFGLGSLGALLGGHNKRVAAGLGGAIIGLVVTENKHRYGHDLSLRAGAKIQLRLGDDIHAAVPAR